ncbi:hypothetical protein ERX46_03880 [Brumimicrobium glaciale]|uniref:O-antigen ligase-related domain-containing protein n=1 Tax=Brumimicrobium glaciale TaxID=200475 RepID=A0A4Q4KMI5_9FLAO|nr:O-antigen ligase family protein [Brumimicrobium glaciale]RYM34522.1 hypothetical protein ERX46_03880 [Brumimicrobium glaciale]
MNQSSAEAELKNNKYDHFLVILICLVAFGMYGGAMQPIRMVSLASLPFLFIQFIKSKRNPLLFRAYLACVFLYLWIALSYFWSTNIEEATKEVVYYFAHFSIFLLIITLYSKATNPLKSLTKGWFILIVLTAFIAFIEIFYGLHMSVNLIPDDFHIRYYDLNVFKRYASVTFGNYNTYVMVITMALPFLFTYLYLHKKFITQFVAILIISFSYFVLMINASRGGLIAGGIILFIWILFVQKQKVHHIRNKLILLIPIAIFVIKYHVHTLFDQVTNRSAAGVSVVEDQGRIELFTSAINAFLQKPFFGSGIGSIQTEMKNVTIFVPHNLVLEFLVQFGAVLGIIVAFLFFKMFIKIPKIEVLPKAILISLLLSTPFIFIINSIYLLHPVLWVFFASIYCVSCFKKQNYSYD